MFPALTLSTSQGSLLNYLGNGDPETPERESDRRGHEGREVGRDPEAGHHQGPGGLRRQLRRRLQRGSQGRYKLVFLPNLCILCLFPLHPHPTCAAKHLFLKENQ